MGAPFRTAFAWLPIIVPVLSFAQQPVNLIATNGDASEAGQVIGTVQISIEESETSPLVIHLQVTGSATYSIDFTTSGMQLHTGDHWSITIPAGETTASATITPRKDNLIEGVEEVSFTLLEDPGYTLGSDTQADVNIADDVATVSLTVDDGLADEEGEDSGRITVHRTNNGKTSEPLTVHMQRTGSASYSIDFTTSGMQLHTGDHYSITIPGNEFSASGVITPRKDNNIEGTETVSFQLKEEATKFFVESLDPVDINIMDDVAVVTFSLSDDIAYEHNESPAQITVQRSDNGDISEALTVSMQRTGSASDSIDFTTSGVFYHGGDHWSIPIPANQLTASGIITPVFDEIVEGDETLVFTLNDGGSKFFTGTPDEVTITIKDFVDLVFKDGFE